MGHWHAGLGRDDRRRESGIHVAHDKDQIRGPLAHDGLESLHRATRLGGMAARTHAQVDVGFRKAELGEEDIRHRDVVMLAGVDKHVLERLAGPPEGGQERRNLHEVGSRANDAEDPAGHGANLRA